MIGPMRTDAFNFDLPTDRIADRPVSPREAARLLEVGERLHDRNVGDLPDLLRPGDALVINDTKVIPARLSGRRGTVRIEATLLRAVGAPPDCTWTALARPAKRLRPGDRIDFAEDFCAEVIARGEAGAVTLRFAPGLDLFVALERHGSTPLPPYINRLDGPDALDREDYQTVYARAAGAVAAPTAGLHLTKALLNTIACMGVEIVTVTLHVGAGTFLPVKADTIRDHKMHAEWGEVTAEAAAAVSATRAAGGRTVSIGTTSLRLLESAADDDGTISAFRGDTSLFITPGYRFRIVDALLTNFHLPRSTLFMLVAAFSGLDRMKAAYAHARDTGYRFYSYGDATFLHSMDVSP